MAKRGPRVGQKKGISKSQDRHAVTLRRAEVSHRILLHHRHEDIAKDMGVSRQTITHDVAVIEKAYKQSSVANVGELKRRHIAKLDALEREALLAWERSKGTKETKSGKETPKGKEKSIRQEDRVGECSFLSEARKVLSDKADIVGIQSPKQVNLNDISKRPIDELLGRIATRLPSLVTALTTGAATK